ncbi:DUF6884 domain-containing protein [Geodermatophilus sp. SYSU D00703]
MTTVETIWDLVRRGADTLPEPFSSKRLIDWVIRQRPDVQESSVRTHIQYATANAGNARNPFGHRRPLLDRVGHGEYRRHRPSAGTPAPPTPQPTAQPPVVGRADVVLVGCSDSKAPSARPAERLFTGAAFVKGRAHALATGRPWYVLSARWGLLAPDDVVAPYDVYLADRPTQYRTAWGAWVVAQLAERHGLRGAAVEVHAGEAYCLPLAGPLAAAGATLHQPLAGLRQGERLAWYGRARNDLELISRSQEIPDISSLLDPARTIAPADFLAAGRRAADRPGLYSWWVDTAGAHELSGLGHRVAPGLVYAGRAGGVRTNGSASTNTLWGRVAGMHLQGNRSFSTFRLTLTAALRHEHARVVDESSLTRWMHDHLRVAVLPLAAADVLPSEERLLGLTDPPLNLQGVPVTPLRRTLSRLRSSVVAEG